MSKTNLIPEATINQLKFISKRISKLNLSKETKASNELWIAGSGGGGGGYDWSQADVGVNAKGEFIVCFQSGCSCNGPEVPSADSSYPLAKGLIVPDESYDDPGGWMTDLVTTTEVIYNAFKNKPVSADSVLKITNVEIRRAIIELIGTEKFVKDANPVVLDTNEEHGELLKLPLEEDEPMVLLHVKDPSTAREYFLRVPPDMKSSAEARAWTFGFEAKDFNPSVET